MHLKKKIELWRIKLKYNFMNIIKMSGMKLTLQDCSRPFETTPNSAYDCLAKKPSVD